MSHRDMKPYNITTFCKSFRELLFLPSAYADWTPILHWRSRNHNTCMDFLALSRLGHPWMRCDPTEHFATQRVVLDCFAASGLGREHMRYTQRPVIYQTLCGLRMLSRFSAKRGRNRKKICHNVNL